MTEGKGCICLILVARSGTFLQCKSNVGEEMNTLGLIAEISLVHVVSDQLIVRHSSNNKLDARINNM